eukprot:TRINITY_DN6688_c0_g1_i1.p1 TRINITY_DN6688_c0_g1~~TRINITY_DN6688_c0_g1_i1.p1  ORF type:complete len:499 (-),score=105.74 TRINITY_DN6688_c0_g1_i1:11-1507(-)
MEVAKMPRRNSGKDEIDGTNQGIMLNIGRDPRVITVGSDLSTWGTDRGKKFIREIGADPFPLSDLVITIQSSEPFEDLLVHKFLLHLSSSIFAGLIASLNESILNLKLSPHEGRVFKLLMDHIYGRSFSVSIDDLPILLDLADRYDLPNLLNLTADALAEQLSSSIVTDVMEIARRYNLPELNRRCLSFLTLYFRKLVSDKSIFQLDIQVLIQILSSDSMEESEEFLLQTIKDYVSKMSEQDSKNALEKLLPCIRFGSLAPEEIVKLEGDPVLSATPIFHNLIHEVYKMKAIGAIPVLLNNRPRKTHGIFAPDPSWTFSNGMKTAELAQNDSDHYLLKILPPVREGDVFKEITFQYSDMMVIGLAKLENGEISPNWRTLRSSVYIDCETKSILWGDKFVQTLHESEPIRKLGIVTRRAGDKLTVSFLPPSQQYFIQEIPINPKDEYTLFIISNNTAKVTLSELTFEQVKSVTDKLNDVSGRKKIVARRTVRAKRTIAS